MQSRSRQLLGNSVAALLAAVEIYNKPSFSYREESFAILAVNAWELLLKARILQLSKNRLSAILDYEKRQKADGSLSDKLYRKRNRSGNLAAIGLWRAFNRLRDEYADSIDEVVKLNLEALCEVRDNAVHFVNKDFDLRKKVHELGTANLKNFLYYVRSWFGTDLAEYQIFLMPIAMVSGFRTADAIVPNAEERRLLEYMREIELGVDDDVNNNTNLTLDVTLRLRRAGDGNAEARITNNPDAVKVRLSEEDVRDKYPWDYKILTSRLRNRYTNFLLNQKYHDLRRPLEENPALCHMRHLDPGNPNSTTKRFYSPNILREFDAHYTRAEQSGR